MSFRKVLVLDTSRFNRETLKGILVEGGFDAETADTGETFAKALEWWRPDALIVDVEFSTADGLAIDDVLASARDARVPTLVMGARVESVLESMATDLGADGAYSTLRGMRGVRQVLDALKERIEKRARADEDKSLDW